jgi:hypothetical protein
MRMTTAIVLGLLGSAVLALPAARAQNTPIPFGEPGCKGRIVATFNHNSGFAKRNPNASAGPGYFLKQDTSEALHEVQDLCDLDQEASEAD